MHYHMLRSKDTHGASTSVKQRPTDENTSHNICID